MSAVSDTNEIHLSEDDETATEDHSILCRPIQTGHSGIQLAINSLKNGSAEVRDLLLNECDLIFECKVCRSLHRSLVNFIAHKRSYCQQHCCESLQLFNDNTVENEEVFIVRPESPSEPKEPTSDEIPQCKVAPPATEESDIVLLDLQMKPISQSEMIKENEVTEEVKKSPQKIFVRKLRESPRWHRSGTNSNGNSKFSQSPLLSNNNGYLPKFYDKCLSHLENRKAFQMETTVEVQQIATNPNAVFQKVSDLEVTVASSFKKSFKSSDKRAICSQCGKRFKSLRKMVVHVQSVHTTQRTYFPCLYCKTNFAQIWSCLRHVMRVHNKSKQQLDRLREKIKSRAFQKPVQGEKHVSVSKPDSPVEVQEVSEEKIIVKLDEKIPVVQLKNAVIHQCSICSKIFSQKPSLDGHRSSCLAKQRARDNAKKLAEAEAEMELSGNNSNERPKRAVKRKHLDDNFVNSSYLNIRTNSVNPPKQTEQKATFTPITSIPQNILRKLNAIIDINKKQCLQCKQTFVTLSNARRHAAGHIGYNRFGCKNCEFQAYGRSQIRCHLLKVHITGKIKAKECDLDRLILSLEQDEEENDNDENDHPQKKIKVEPIDENGNDENDHPEIKIKVEPIDENEPFENGEKPSETENDGLNSSPINTETEENVSPAEISENTNLSECTSNSSSCDESDLQQNSVIVLATEYDDDDNQGDCKHDNKKSSGKLEPIINRLNLNDETSESIYFVDFDDNNALSCAADDHNYYASSSPDKCSSEVELIEAVESITD